MSSTPGDGSHNRPQRTTLEPPIGRGGASIESLLLDHPELILGSLERAEHFPRWILGSNRSSE